MSDDVFKPHQELKNLKPLLDKITEGYTVRGRDFDRTAKVIHALVVRLGGRVVLTLSELEVDNNVVGMHVRPLENGIEIVTR